MKNRTFYSIFLVVLFLSSSFTNAQNRTGGRHRELPAIGEISGRVVNSETDKPIEYASVSVNRKDGIIETGGVTDTDGRFLINEIKPGIYDLKVEFMGYEPQTLTDIKLSFQGNIKKDVGEIRLKPVLLEMDAVNVVDDRPVYEFETDKMIYNTSDDIISDSGTAEDVLNKVPMVTVDQEGEISLRGNPNVKILVNGRPNRTGHESDKVDNIPASLIDRVEVITSPSAKYDPEGMAGIINIIMKKGKYEGLNGSLKINGKQNNYGGVGDMNGFTAFGNYKGEKWNVYSSYNLRNNLRFVNGHRKVFTHYLPDGPSDSVYFNFDMETVRGGHSFTFGSDYSVDDQLLLNGEINFNLFTHTGLDLERNFLPEESIRKVDEIDFDDNYNVEGFFELHKTYENPDKELKISISRNHKEHHEYEILQDFDVDSTKIDEDLNQMEIDFSYNHPINEKSKFELGYDGKFEDNLEYMDYQITSEEGQFSGMNDFGYKRNIHGLYFEYDFSFNSSFSVKPSIRYENIQKDISFQSDITEDENSSIIYAQILNSLQDSVYKDNYSTVYPDLHFTYNLTDKKSIQFGMSKRVNRPGGGRHGHGARQLRPFPRDVYSENFVFLGNPFLKPEYSTQFDLSYKSPMPMGFAYVNLYYHQLENVIEWYDDDRFDDKDVLTFRNADSGTNLGVEVFTMVMGQTLGGGYNLSKLEDPSGDYELNGNSKRLTIYSRINLPEKYIKLFSFEFGLFFMKLTVPGGNLFGSKGTTWANMGFSKSLFDSRMEVSLGINNLFNSGGFQMTREKPLRGDFENGYSSALEYTDVATNRGGRTFKINFIYRFGQLQEEKRKTRHAERGENENMDMGF